MEDKTAILIDGDYYIRRARSLFGQKDAKDRAKELENYCSLHIKDGKRHLYRVFYYDCPPLDRTVFHPLTRKHINLGKSDMYAWRNAFFKALLSKRKFALRLGRLSDLGHGYKLNPDAVKKLCEKKITIDDLKESDFSIEIEQKGVDMRIGIDIAHLAYKRLVTQIILISGDSDFVPAAKLARREGIDIILDPMGSHIAEDLWTHIDGLKSHWNDKQVLPQKS